MASGDAASRAVLPARWPDTSAAAPAFTCTTAPPAKSSAPRSANQPPANTQCATGRYTRIDQRPMKPTHAGQRMRSAIEPVISAGVMTANVSWNATNASVGDRSRYLAAHSFQADEVEVSDQASVTRVAERERVPEDHPDHRHDAQGEEVLHEHREDVLGAHHAAVEEREPRSHEHHECRRNEHPCGIASIDVRHELLPLTDGRARSAPPKTNRLVRSVGGQEGHDAGRSRAAHARRVTGGRRCAVSPTPGAARRAPSASGRADRGRRSGASSRVACADVAVARS